MKRRGTIWAFLLVVALGLAGFGLIGCPNGDGKNGENGGNGDSDKVAFPADKATATIQGKINFTGAAPPRKEIRQVADNPKCAMIHGDKKVLDEIVVINGNKTVRDVFVQITKFPEAWNFKKVKPKNKPVLKQKGCVYKPHMIGLKTGQKLKITSGDGFDHNVHFMGEKNRKKNKTMKKGDVLRWSFPQPEFTYIKCDVHSWMKTEVCIVRHPFFAVTGEDGSFEIGKLPPGKYTVQIWHAKFGTKKKEIELKANATTPVDFTFDATDG